LTADAAGKEGELRNKIESLEADVSNLMQLKEKEGKERASQISTLEADIKAANTRAEKQSRELQEKIEQLAGSLEKNKELRVVLEGKEKDLAVKEAELLKIITSKEEELREKQTQSEIKQEELQHQIENLQHAKEELQEKDEQLRIAAEQKLQAEIDKVRNILPFDFVCLSLLLPYLLVAKWAKGTQTKGQGTDQEDREHVSIPNSPTYWEG